MRSIYLDYNATTPLDPEVRQAMEPYLTECWGNPSSVHHVGRRARFRLDDLRERAARALECRPSEITFTSGGTEANNLAVFGAARARKPEGRHLLVSAIEHQAVLGCYTELARREGFDLTILPVAPDGRVRVEDWENSLRPDTVLASLMAANNETGTIQPVAECGAVCRARGVLFHTDAVQWFAKLPFSGVSQFNADLVTLCAHKFHGPKGAGLLYSRSPFQPHPFLFGGGQEQERRAGTENLPAIAGLVAAMERFIKPPVFLMDSLARQVARLRQVVSSIPGCTLLGSPAHCLNNTVSFVTEQADSITLLAALDLEGICASGGAACSAGSLEPSHVVRALGFSEPLARSLVRFSLGRDSSDAEMDQLCAVLPAIVQRAQSG